MCNCDKEMTAKLKVKLYPEATSIWNVDRDILSGRTLSHYEITVPGKKKPKQILIGHSFCPYCGRQYEEAPV